MPNLNGTKFTVEVPSTQGKPHLKFKENPLTILEIQAIKFSKKLSSFFIHLTKIAVTCKCILQSG